MFWFLLLGLPPLRYLLGATIRRSALFGTSAFVCSESLWEIMWWQQSLWKVPQPLADFHRRPPPARSHDRRFGRQRIAARDQARDDRVGYASSETFAVCNSDTQASRPRQSCAASIADIA